MFASARRPNRNLLASRRKSDNLLAMDVSMLDYELPHQLIAQNALPDRSASRLLVMDRKSGQIDHRAFENILDYLRKDDCLVLNDSKVIPARFYLRRHTGGTVEGLFLRQTEQNDWRVLLKHSRRIKPGEILHFCKPGADQPDSAALTILEKQPQGIWRVKPVPFEDPLLLLDRFGCPPLPPYIHRSRQELTSPADFQRYQTVYAKIPGSIAAPTAGLHFTPELLERLRDRSVRIARVTLHGGMGTFKPITVEKLEDHVMHREACSLDQNAADLINQTKQNSGRIIAVGTTSVRTLETMAQNQQVLPGARWTSLFITPGYRFQIVDALITNFHLPRSTLLALVCAFAGRDQILRAYRLAVENQYRFFSYGDAMLIL